MKKLRRISIKKNTSTRISKVLSFSVISENTRLKKVKSQFFLNTYARGVAKRA